ncbi:zinc ribbon domain-containing protein [Lysinibacillus sp. NPDC095746]
MWSSNGVSFSCDCGFVADRDWNAAFNMKQEGLRLLR